MECPCPGATCLRRACSHLLVHVWVDVCGASTELYDVGVWHDDTQYDEDVPRDHERGGCMIAMVGGATMERHGRHTDEPE